MQKAKKKAAPKAAKKNNARVSRATVATVLVLRTCNPDLTSHNGFKWPQKGAVKAPDWDSRAICGYGLHGLLWGEGEGAHLNYSADAKWLVVEVPAESIVDLKGKVKFPAGKVVFCGDRLGATGFLALKRPSAAICGGTATAGSYGTATAGDSGTATAGDSGTATAGSYGTATAGDSGTATAGDSGTATAGVGGTATAGDSGTATAGDSGTATAGVGGTATAGNSGTATAGYYGTATAGYYGTATAGVGGTATAGYSGTATAGVGGTATAGYYGTATAGVGGTATAGVGGRLEILFYDSKSDRWRKALAYVGEGGIKPNVKYKLDGSKFVEAK